MKLALHEFHENLGARFGELNGAKVVAGYGDPALEYSAFRGAAGVIDLSFRGRLCVIGNDRVRFLHGQITNDVKKLRTGEGCYTALVTAKGKMECDANVLVLADEMLLDLEPGMSAKIAGRLEKYIVADDVHVVDVASQYGLLSVQGPKSREVVDALRLQSSGDAELPTQCFGSVKFYHAMLGEIYAVNLPRLNASLFGARSSTERESIAPDNQAGFDLFVPVTSLAVVADKLIAGAKSLGGRACGWSAFETARIEAGIPRFGADMDESNIPLECGIEDRAISYTKGCYIGQEVINRVHSIGHVNRELCRLQFSGDLQASPDRGDKLFKDDQEVGHITSAAGSPIHGTTLALGYVRRGFNCAGEILALETRSGRIGMVVL